MGDDVEREALLAELGYSHPEAQREALAVLEAARLTNARKSRIALAKRERCQAALAAALVRRCDRCGRRDGPADGRRPVPVGRADECDVCGGSPNRLAVRDAATAFRARGLARLAVVGGSPAAREELRELWPADLELKLVDGTGRHDRKAASAVLRWADVVLVWGSTPLDHRVSTLYTAAPAGGAGVVGVTRRGVEALAEALRRHLAGPGASRPPAA
jgi:hypothetical protein